MPATRHLCRILTVCSPLLFVACAGCWTPPNNTIAQERRGLVVMFPGVNGHPARVRCAYHGLRDAGVDQAIVVQNWVHPLGSVANVVDIRTNRRLAHQYADAVTRYAERYPGRPVDFVGYSGGGALAVMTAEVLPRHVRLRNLVLAQAALSRRYDLTRALKQVEGELVSFYCPTDWFILGLGTSVFGTVDRVFGPSAGKEGFELERAAPDGSLRRRVRQIAWDHRALAAGHWGGHMGIQTAGWNRIFVAPLLRVRLGKQPGGAHPMSGV